MTAPAIIAELVERFDAQRDSYRAGAYHETQLRREFLDPFFEALGWDVYNRKGYAEAYKEVIHEDAIKVGGRTKAPDYCFRAGGGMRSFFVEAKKPAVDIREAVSPAFQLRRYAWSAKLPVSILTDFEELAVYDCRIRPQKTDKAMIARVKFYTYAEYLQRWEELCGLFSPEAIRRGSLEKLVASKKVKKGTAEVDAAFLEEIESWRDLLARNIALRNPGLSPRDLNFAVQRTIDRLVFLRICEDRGIQPYGRLQGLANGPGVYRRLCELFQQADQRYNSGLFYFSAERLRAEPPDQLTLGLSIDDRPLREILANLYYPESPYEFSVLPAEILGQVYEQFLGKVIRLTKGGQAKVEEKPEVRKAGGVYYTPAYIVEYIVTNTVGKLLEGRGTRDEGGAAEEARGTRHEGRAGEQSLPSPSGRGAGGEGGVTPKEAARLRILDPACGSGSFLIGAYQHLLDWHRDWYVAHDPERHARGRSPALYCGAGGQWRLTTAERKRILLNNVYGVDIDPQAVEVTKLSLLLKVLEGESDETLANQLRLFHERALPDLGSNIKCGNSLIGPDFYEGRQQSLLDDEQRWRINVFDWQAEFPHIFPSPSGRGQGEGGFDAVIGNPPYLFLTEVAEEMRGYYQQAYHGVSYRFDLYGAFIEKALVSLMRPGSVLGFIIPHTLLSNDSFQALRSILAAKATIYQVMDFGPGVFQDAKNETMLLFFQNSPACGSAQVDIVRTSPKEYPDFAERFSAIQQKWAAASGDPWLIHVSDRAAQVVDRISAAANRLGDFCTANQGLRTGDNDKYLSEKPLGPTWKPAAGGKHISRYAPIPKGLYVRYEPDLLDAPRRPEIFTAPAKLVVQEIRNIRLARRIVATLDAEQMFCLQSTNVINTNAACALDIRYLLGVLNSTAVNYFFRCSFPGNNHIPSNQLLRIPIPKPSQTSPHDRMVALVDSMLALHRELAAARTGEAKTLIQRQIDAADRQIDRLVYELYGLTDAEIAIVEGAAGRA